MKRFLNAAGTQTTGEDREQETMMRKMTKKTRVEDRTLEDAREFAPVQDEMARIRAYVEATRAW
jgi:hypothetical protein